MGDSKQELLRKAWLGGRQGNLSPMMEAKAWALREIWNDDHESSYGMLGYIPGKMVKVAAEGDEPEQPTKQAMAKFVLKVDAGPDWYLAKARKRNMDQALPSTLPIKPLLLAARWP